jgi:tetratricopeptide (TPR) repeat protein
MKATKCVVCTKVKGKRACQLNAGALICPRCCAQVRNTDCEGCFYYAQAESYALEKAQKSENRPFVARIDPQVDETIDRALAMLESGKRSAGERIIADMLKKHPDLHVVQYAMGVVCAMKEQYDESIKYFDKATEIFPYFVEAWFNKGVSYQKTLEFENAILAFQKVVELGDPADDFVQHSKDLLSDIEQEIREVNEISLDDYLKAKEKFDEAFAAMQRQDWQQALEGFQGVLALNPNHPQSHGNMGICYAHLGRKQEALAALDKALELDPNYEPAQLNRVTVASLAEGEKLADERSRYVDYYKDYPTKKKSLFERFTAVFRA